MDDRTRHQIRPADAFQPWIVEWIEPFLDFVARERRLSEYTVRNYRQAVEEFGRWLTSEKGGPLRRPKSTHG